MKTSLCAAVALAILASSEAVQGVSIQIGLVAPGALSFDTKVPFDDLNRTALLGQSVSVDFMFTSSEFARLFTVTTDPLVSDSRWLTFDSLRGRISYGAMQLLMFHRSDNQPPPLKPWLP